VKEYFVSFYYDKTGKLFLVLGIKEDREELYDWPQNIQDEFQRFGDISVSESISVKYPKSRMFSEYPIDIGNIDYSLESQKEDIKSGLTEALLLYTQTLQRISAQSVPNKVNYWRVAPGKNGVLWNIWKNENICSIGYHQYEPYLEELLTISDKNSFYQKLVEIAQQNNGAKDFSFMLSSQPTIHQNTIWSFFQEMKPGDIVIASTGRSQIYGVGTLLSGISSRDSEELSILREVRWDQVGLDASIPQDVLGNFTITLNKLTADDYSKIINSIQKKDNSPEIENEIESGPILNLLHRKGQVILYGPPGTGKTYHVQELINNKNQKPSWKGSGHRDPGKAQDIVTLHMVILAQDIVTLLINFIFIFLYLTSIHIFILVRNIQDLFPCIDCCPNIFTNIFNPNFKKFI
jgi:hypothetical protein